MMYEILGRRYFGAESRNTDFEFHGAHIYSGKGRYFKKLSMDKRIDLINELVEIINNHKDLKIGYVCINKSKYYGKNHIQQTAFALLTEKIEKFLKRNNSYGLLVSDETR